MNRKPVKCRTCLKNSTKTFPLTKYAIGCSPEVTYSRLLQDYAQVECSADYEHLMPQTICALCCRGLCDVYFFIRQAQYCNNKLINLINKQLPSLQEKVMVSTNGGNLSKDFLAKKIKNNVKDNANDTTNQFRIVSTSVLLNCVELEEFAENYEQITSDVDAKLENETNDNNQNESNCINLECPINYDTNGINTNVADYEYSNGQFKTCPICKETIDGHNNLLTHMRVHHDVKAPSKYLNKQEKFQVNHLVNELSIVKKQENQNPKDKVIKCCSCNYTARNYASMNFHNLAKHGTENNKFKCKFCPFMSLQKFSLFMHVKNSHKELIRTLKTNAKNKLQKRKTSDDDVIPIGSLTAIKEKDNVNGHSGNCSTSLEQKEGAIDQLEDKNFLENFFRIYMENNIVDKHTKYQDQNSKSDKFSSERSNVQSNVQSKDTNDIETISENEDSNKIEVNECKQNYSNDSNIPDDTQFETDCPICGKITSKHNLTKHMYIQHEIESDKKFCYKAQPEPKEAYACKICCSKYTNKYTYLYHLKHKHGIDKRKCKGKKHDKIIKCRSCDYTARTYAALNYHTRSKHGTENDKFKCKFCSHMCIKKFDLLTHVKNCHKELIKSLKAEAENNCNQRETLIGAATLALPKLESVKNATISDDEEFSSNDDTPLVKMKLKSNSNSKLDEDKEKFSDEEFIRNILNIKKRQIKSSTKSLARRCDECGNIYKNYKALYAHQRHVHISEDKYSLCPHCGKKYKRKTDLKIHIEKAHISKNSTGIAKQPAKKREKRFMCTECSYVCTTITILNIHINRHHTGEKPYKCDICFKSFLVPYDVKIHRYLHTGERPYKCPVCSKGFRDKSHMIKHKRIHSTERPYKCKDCSKSFTQPYNLSVHKRTHLKEKKLNCVVCGKVFENRSLLNIHRINENHHDDVE